MTQISESPATIEATADQLDQAMARIAGLEPEARRAIERALEALNALHKAGLTTLVRTMKDDPRGKELLFDLVDEPDVRMILAMHGIIRPDPETLARRVLDQLRIGLQSHGGDVELDGIRGGVAYVRLQGACNGCSMAAVTMRDGVEKALVEGVPGVTAVEVLPNDPTPTLIPLSSIGIGAPASTQDPAALRAAGWCPTFAVADLRVDAVRSISLQPEAGPSVEAIVVNSAGQLAAYVNSCAHQGLPLDDAKVDPVDGTLTCPWHGFCYDATTGECTSMPGAQLQQLPLRLEGGQVWVRTTGL
jgi:nitrite reductase/ring-hydroxylating ferredoxin subunit/Fe-S cluster biogenesis protein NfuA